MRKIILWAVIIVLVLAMYLGLVIFGPALLGLVHVKAEDAKTMVDALKSFTETVAVVIAGIWTYNRFIKSREDYPYPKIQHRVEHYKLDEFNGSLIYLSVFVTVVNEGKNKLDNVSGEIFIEQVSPLTERIKESIATRVSKGEDAAIRLGKVPELFTNSEQRLNFDSLGRRDWKQKELEPGQTKIMQFDFLIEQSVTVISVTNHFSYEKSAGESDFATLHSLTGEDAAFSC
jgi:hypothetical protein